MTAAHRNAVLLLAACLTACSRPVPAPPRPIVTVVPKGSTHDFWRFVRAGASQEARRLNVQLQWPNAVREGDLQAQWDVIAQARALAAEQRARLAVVLAPLARHAWVEPVAELQDNGHPVIVFDSELDSDDYVSFVGTNNRAAGRDAADYMVRLLGGRGNVAVLRLNPLSDSTNEREEGFLEEISGHPEVRVVSQDRYAGGLVVGALTQAHALLDSLRDRGIELDGVFTPNESTTVGFFKALQDDGLSRRVRLVGFDQTALLVHAVWRGQIAALVVQDPVEIGRRSVTAAVEALGWFDEIAPLRRSNRAEYQRRLREAIPPVNYVPYQLVDRGDLERGVRMAEQLGLGTVRQLGRAPALRSAAPDPAQAKTVDVFRVLYPNQDIVH